MDLEALDNLIRKVGARLRRKPEQFLHDFIRAHEQAM